LFSFQGTGVRPTGLDP